MSLSTPWQGRGSCHTLGNSRYWGQHESLNAMARAWFLSRDRELANAAVGNAPLNAMARAWFLSHVQTMYRASLSRHLSTPWQRLGCCHGSAVVNRFRNEPTLNAMAMPL